MAVPALSLVWLVFCYYFYRLVLRSSFFYCGLVLVDLFAHEIPEVVKKRGFWLAWLVAMSEVIFIQIFGYLVYYYFYGTVHLEAPPLLLYYVMPDTVLVVLMLLAFYLAFELKNKVKREKKKLMKPAQEVESSETRMKQGEDVPRQQESLEVVREVRVVEPPQKRLEMGQEVVIRQNDSQNSNENLGTSLPPIGSNSP